jgi:ATP-dependent DNA helicase HFM1/MER3
MEMEVVDLAKDRLPVTYADLAPREYRKLNALHNSVHKNQPDKVMRLPKQKPQFEYGSGKEAQLPFRREAQKDADISGSGDEMDLPSPSKMWGTKKKSPDPFEKGMVIYQNQNPISSFPDDSLESLEAGMLGLSDSTMLRAATPKIDSSFPDGIFDFDAYNKDHETPTGDTVMHSIEAPSPPALAMQSLKRAPSPSLEVEEPEMKYRRVAKPEPAQLSSVPAWVDEFDSDLIEGLKGIVDFVD